MTADNIDLTRDDTKKTPGRRWNEWTAERDPTSTDDESLRFEIGSRWLNKSTTPTRMWECVVSTVGAAVWTRKVWDHGDLDGNEDRDHPEYSLIYHEHELYDLYDVGADKLTPDEGDHLVYGTTPAVVGAEYSGPLPVITVLYYGAGWINESFQDGGLYIRLDSDGPTEETWYQMEFDQPYRFGAFSVGWQHNTNKPSQIIWECSQDGIIWETVYDVVGVPATGVVLAAFDDRDRWRKFWRMRMPNHEGPDGPQFEAVRPFLADGPGVGWSARGRDPDLPTEVYEDLGSAGTADGEYSAGDHKHPTQELTAWKGPWSPISYRKNDMVRDGEWLAVANTTPATDRPAPQPSGLPAWVSGEGDTPTWGTPTPDVAQEVIYGQEYTLPESGYITGLRLWIPSALNAASFEVWLVADPKGAEPAASILISEFVPDTDTPRDEWVTVPVGSTLVRDGTVFDIVVLLRNREGIPIITTADWNYVRTGTTPPASGAIHHLASAEFLRVHKTDANANDQSVMLATIGVGDTIAASGQAWSVTSITDNGTWIEFGISPAVRIGVNGLYTFTFTAYPDASLDYVRIDNHYLADPAVEGFYSLTGYANRAGDEHMYGVDIEVQDAFISDEWDFMAISGGGSGGGSGAPGPPGTPGTVWHTGTGTPSPALGIDGDFYLDDANGDVYTKAGGAWSVTDNLTGPQGDQGDVGPPGTTLHAGLTDVTGDQHHAQTHGHDGADGSGVVQTWEDVRPLVNGHTLEDTEQFITESAGVVYLNFQAKGGGDVTFMFQGVEVVMDCTPVAQIALTAGTDTDPVQSAVYVTESAGVITLEASTDTFPRTYDFGAIATVLVQSPASVALYGPYKHHAWTDHVQDSILTGHLQHINAKVRIQPATWRAGTAASPLTIVSPDASFTVDAGEVYQLHPHLFPARDISTDGAFIPNDPTTPYKRITSFDDITQDSKGGVINNRWFPLVVWACVSEKDTDCKVFINLPGGTYANESQAVDDAANYGAYRIPSEFRGTGFLIARYTVQGKDNGLWVENADSPVDLRSLHPTLSPGAGTAITEHSGLAGILEDDHHAKSHAHDAVDGSGTVAHADTTARTPDDHHSESHGHTGVDGSGTVAHSATTGLTSDDHHAESHSLASHTGSLAHAATTGITADDHHDHKALGTTGVQTEAFAVDQNTITLAADTQTLILQPSVTDLKVEGLVGGVQGRILNIFNDSAYPIDLEDEDSDVVDPTQRFGMSYAQEDWQLSPHSGSQFIYSSSRWRGWSAPSATPTVEKVYLEQAFPAGAPYYGDASMVLTSWSAGQSLLQFRRRPTADSSGAWTRSAQLVVDADTVTDGVDWSGDLRIRASAGGAGRITLWTDLLRTYSDLLTDIGQAGERFANAYIQNVYATSLLGDGGGVIYVQPSLADAYRFDAAKFYPIGTKDIGSSGNQWRNAYFSGTVYVPKVSGNGGALVLEGGATNADINWDGTQFYPVANGVDSLGWSGSQWKDAYFSGTVYTPNVQHSAELVLQTTGGAVVLRHGGGDVRWDGTALFPSVAYAGDLGTGALPWADIKAEDLFLTQLTDNQFSSPTIDFHRRSAAGGAVPGSGSYQLGTFQAYGNEGTADVRGSSMVWETSAAVSTGIVPTRWYLELMDAAGAYKRQLSVDPDSVTVRDELKTPTLGLVGDTGGGAFGTAGDIYVVDQNDSKVKGRFRFLNWADGNYSALITHLNINNVDTEMLRLTNAGFEAAKTGMDLGSASWPWKDGYFGNNVVVGSNVYAADIRGQSSGWLGFWALGVNKIEFTGAAFRPQGADDAGIDIGGAATHRWKNAYFSGTVKASDVQADRFIGATMGKGSLTGALDDWNPGSPFPVVDTIFMALAGAVTLSGIDSSGFEVGAHLHLWNGWSASSYTVTILHASSLSLGTNQIRAPRNLVLPRYGGVHLVLSNQGAGSSKYWTIVGVSI